MTRRAVASRIPSTGAAGDNKKGHNTGRLVPDLNCDPWCQRTIPNPLGGVTGECRYLNLLLFQNRTSQSPFQEGAAF